MSVECVDWIHLANAVTNGGLSENDNEFSDSLNEKILLAYYSRVSERVNTSDISLSKPPTSPCCGHWIYSLTPTPIIKVRTHTETRDNWWKLPPLPERR